jgi:hypothetical protein
MRYEFWRVFAETEDGQLYTQWPLDLGGVKLRAGDRICPAASISGFNPHCVKGRDLEGYRRSGELVIKAVYHNARSGGASRFDRGRTRPFHAAKRSMP